MGKNSMFYKPENFILDVDGVLTDGGLYYTLDGKFSKRFGQYDTDILNRLKILTGLNIEFVTSDSNSRSNSCGVEINKLRCEHMGFKCYFCDGSYNRLNWLKNKYNINKTIYMGDSLSDYKALEISYYSIAPRNAFDIVKEIVDYVTHSDGGHGAVAEACIQIYKFFFKKETDDIIDIFTSP